MQKDKQKSSDSNDLSKALKLTADRTSTVVNRAWPKEDISTLIQGIREHGRNWSLIAPLLPERNRSNIQSMTTSLKSKF